MLFHRSLQLLATATAILASSPQSIEKYIITLKPEVNRAAASFDLERNVLIANATITSKWNIIPAFAVEATRDAIAVLQSSNANIQSIEPDGIVTISSPLWSRRSLITQYDATWGLARLSAPGRLNGSPTGEYPYVYDEWAGQGVDVYVIDTGINIAHPEFGGRAVWGATFGGYANEDGNGHGTHCAGLIASSKYGVAKLAKVIAVRVLSDSGSGSISNVLSGMDYALQASMVSGNPSVVNMALGGSASVAIDNAVASLTSSGVHLVAAAGGSNSNANSSSPGRAPSANTVGATDINDSRASFSSYGEVIDIWAPGVSIESTWIGSGSPSRVISGTSMATSYVSGLLAYLISVYGKRSPSGLTAFMQSIAQEGVLSDIPSGTVNLMAHNAA